MHKAVAGLIFILCVSAINYFWWGDAGFIVHLMGLAVPTYTLIWLWISMIAMMFGFSLVVNFAQKQSVWPLVAIWWAFNILIIESLQAISYRPVESAGSYFAGLPSLIYDFVALGALDLCSLFIIWLLVIGGMITASVWTVIFSGFLVVNLFGHAFGAYGLMTGLHPEMIAQSYDSYMYLAFTLMLAVQVFGSGFGAILRLGGSNVDIYSDIRPSLHRVAGRHTHIS